MAFGTRGVEDVDGDRDPSGIEIAANYNTYWSKKFEFLCCIITAQAMSCDMYEGFMRCLHLKKQSEQISLRQNPNMEKIYKIRWILEAFRYVWNDLAMDMYAARNALHLYEKEIRAALHKESRPF